MTAGLQRGGRAPSRAIAAGEKRGGHASRRSLSMEMLARSEHRDTAMELVYGRMTDLLERTRNKRDLRQTRAELLAVLRIVIDAVLTLDERGIIRSANPAASRMFGFLDHEMIGCHVRTLIPSAWKEG